MTPQEQQMIDGLITRIRSTQVADKDLAADEHLQQGLAGYPDAVYVLAQTVIVQQYGLQQAQAQIQALQSQVDELRQHPAPAPAGGSFLSHLFGGGSQQSAAPQSQPQPVQPPYQPVNNPGYPPQYAAAPYPPVYAQPSGYAPAGGGFLRGAMQTAAGVAAGEVAFMGMESLFHGFGGGYGGGFGGGGFSEGRTEEVINNYYGDDRGEDRDSGRADTNFPDSQRDTGLHDASYVTDGGTNLPASGNEDLNLQSDTDNGDLTDSGSSIDDSSFDNSGGNNSDFDSGDGGGFDGGGDVSF
jgi:hypothetical protein